jgi:hypothetical protein
VVLLLLELEERGADGRRLPPTLHSKDNTLFSFDQPQVFRVDPDHARTSGPCQYTEQVLALREFSKGF